MTPNKEFAEMLSDEDLRRMVVFRCAEGLVSPDKILHLFGDGLLQADRDLRCLPEDDLEQMVKALLKPNRVAHVLGCRD